MRMGMEIAFFFDAQFGCAVSVLVFDASHTFMLVICTHLYPAYILDISVRMNGKD